MNPIQVFFSSRLTGIFCTLLSIIAINSIQQTIPNLAWDNSFSIAAAKSLSQGHGYSIPTARPDDISKSHYEPLNKWPPGYSFLLVLTQSISSLGWIQSAFLLNAIGLSLLVLLFKKILWQLQAPPWMVHVAVLYFGFVFHYYMGIYFTDIFALLFFMSGCSLLLQYVKANQRQGYLVVLAGFLFGFSAWLKYLYFGLAFIPLLSLCFFGWKRKKKIIWRTSITGIFITGLCVGLLILFQLRNSGEAAYIKPSSATGFYPLQLMGLAPIVPGTFLNLNFISMQISTHTRLDYEGMFKVWKVINLLSLCLLICICWPMIKTTDYFKQESRNFYSLMGLWVSVFLFIFLGLLTLRYNSHYEDMSGSWVFVGIERYFAPFCFLTFQLFILLFQKPTLFPNSILYQTFRILMVCIMLEEISHGTYFIVKQVFIKKEFGLHRPDDEQELRSAFLAVAERGKKNVVVVCAGMPDPSNFSSLNGTSSIMDLSLLGKPPYSSQEVLIITCLDRFSAVRMPPEFFTLDTHLIAECLPYTWYFTRIHPNIPSTTDSR